MKLYHATTAIFDNFSIEFSGRNTHGALGVGGHCLYASQDYQQAERWADGLHKITYDFSGRRKSKDAMGSGIVLSFTIDDDKVFRGADCVRCLFTDKQLTNAVADVMAEYGFKEDDERTAKIVKHLSGRDSTRPHLGKSWRDATWQDILLKKYLQDGQRLLPTIEKQSAENRGLAAEIVFFMKDMGCSINTMCRSTQQKIKESLYTKLGIAAILVDGEEVAIYDLASLSSVVVEGYIGNPEPFIKKGWEKGATVIYDGNLPISLKPVWTNPSIDRKSCLKS